MIHRAGAVPQYGWEIDFFADFTCDRIHSVLRMLEETGCSGEFLEAAFDNMRQCALDTGLTYSSSERSRSVVVVYRTSSDEEFANTLAHEVAHVCTHIAQTFGIDPYGEEVCELYGHVVGQLCGLLKLALRE